MDRQISQASGILALTLLLLLFGTATLYGQQAATVSLNGFSNIPPVQSSGSGSVTVVIDDDQLSVEGEISDLDSRYTSSGIYYGSPRETGNQLIKLHLETGENSRQGEFRREDNTFDLRSGIREALEAGNLYISVSTEENRSGELRGQVPPLGNGQWQDYDFFENLDEQEITVPQ